MLCPPPGCPPRGAPGHLREASSLTALPACTAPPYLITRVSLSISQFVTSLHATPPPCSTRDPSVLPTVHPQQGWGPWEPQPQPSPVGSSAAQDTLEHDQVLLLRVPRGLGPLLCKAGGNLRGPPGGLTCAEGARPAARHAVRQRLSRGLCPGQECRGQLATCLS